MTIQAGIYKTPYQKIFTDRQDLNLFLLKLIRLLSNKKINVAKKDVPGGYENYIRVYTREEALDILSDDEEKKALLSVPSIKLQTTQTAEFLKNYFNVRILLGFDTRSSSEPKTIARDLFSGSNSNYIFLFCYLQIFRYKSTWRTVISKGNYGNSLNENDELKYNIIAQDILGDYFQKGLYKSYITNKKTYG